MDTLDNPSVNSKTSDWVTLKNTPCALPQFQRRR